MNIPAILHLFAADDQFKAVVIFIAIDIVLGITASIANKGQQFTLTYIANFTRNDVLGKVVPWFVLFAVGKSSNASVLGIDFGTIADGMWVVVSGALVGSMLTSLGDLGVPLPAALNRHAAPQITAPAQ